MVAIGLLRLSLVAPLICSSLFCHFDWQEQTAADVVEPDVPLKVECQM
jgi:hypothetical protein